MAWQGMRTHTHTHTHTPRAHTSTALRSLTCNITSKKIPCVSRMYSLLLKFIGTDKTITARDVTEFYAFSPRETLKTLSYYKYYGHINSLRWWQKTRR